MLSNHTQTKSIFRPNFLDIIYLIVFMGIFYALWIGSHALFIPDEGRYSEVAREMVASGDYITPRLNGVAFLDKPALYYWLQASAIHLFGLKEWALRFWPAFMGVLGTIITYLAGRVLFSRRAGLISAIMLGTTPLYYGAAHYANLDLEVAALIGNSLLCFLAGIQTENVRVRRNFLLSAYAFSGLAVLTKGLIGIVFPLLIVGSWILILNKWSMLKKIYLGMGCLIFLAITLPWYVLVQKANPEFLHFFFVTQQVSRFLTTQDFNSKAAIWFYIPVVLAGFFPWSVFLIQSLVQTGKRIWSDRKRYSVELFLLLWFSIVLIFFSIPKSKTVGYILPIFPVAALLVGNYLNNAWSNSRIKDILVGGYAYLSISIVVGIAFFILPYFQAQLHLPIHMLPLLRCMSLTLFVSAFFTSMSIRKCSMNSLFLSLTVTIGVLLLMFLASADGLNEKSIKPLAIQLKPTLTSNDEIVTFYKYYQDLPIYLERRITIVADWHAADIGSKDNWLRELWYGMVFQDTKDWLIEENTFWKRWNSNKRLFVLTDVRYFNNFKNKPNVYKIQEYNHVVLFSNKPRNA